MMRFVYSKTPPTTKSSQKTIDSLVALVRTLIISYTAGYREFVYFCTA